MSGVHQLQWVIWVIGAVVFAAAIGVFIRAVVRAGRRPPERHSAAERLHEASLPAELQAQLQALAAQRDAGTMADADYSRQRAVLLQGR